MVVTVGPHPANVRPVVLEAKLPNFVRPLRVVVVAVVVVAVVVVAVVVVAVVVVERLVSEYAATN